MDRPPGVRLDLHPYVQTAPGKEWTDQHPCVDDTVTDARERPSAQRRSGWHTAHSGCGGQGSDAVDGSLEIYNETAVESPEQMTPQTTAGPAVRRLRGRPYTQRTYSERG